MTETTPSLTLDDVRAARRRINAYIAQELRELGVDDARLAQEAAGTSGLEFLERWFQPETPPPPGIIVLLGIEWVEVAEGRAALAFEPAEWMLNPVGAVHGGITATLLDSTLTNAVHSKLPPGTVYGTSDLHVRFIRPVSLDTGRVVATGNVVHQGRTRATAEGRVEVEATGKLIATATVDVALIGLS